MGYQRKMGRGIFSKESGFGARLRREERGNSVLEFAISLPFIAFLTTSVVDIGNALNEYMLLTEAVHQGARMASGQTHYSNHQSYHPTTCTDWTAPDWDPSTCYFFSGLTAAGSTGCTSTTSLTSDHEQRKDFDSHKEVHERVLRNVLLHNKSLEASELCIESTIRPGADTGELVAVVRVRARYDSFFPFFSNIPVTVEAKAPFLQG